MSAKLRYTSPVVPPTALAQRALTVAELRRRDPYWLDRVIRLSGEVYRRSARCSKHLARAHGIDDSRGRSYRRGDEHSPLTHALTLLSTSPLTTAWPALVEGIAIVIGNEIETASDAQLAARRGELERLEHRLGFEHRVATWERNDEACIDAHTRCAAAHMELLAVIREQVRRKQQKAS